MAKFVPREWLIETRIIDEKIDVSLSLNPAEREMVVRQRKQFVLVDIPNKVELAPVFDHEITASEIAHKATNGVQFFDRIPELPYGSPVPRPPRTVSVKPTPGNNFTRRRDTPRN